MPKLFIERSAADNAYLHKDFHGALSTGIQYIDDTLGEEAVRRYLRQFARTFYAPLTADINARGLLALKEHLERIYDIEQGLITLYCTEDELTLKVHQCPAVMHMRANGYIVARLFSETSRTVYETICEGTPFQAEMQDYDDETGRSIMYFSRRTR